MDPIDYEYVVRTSRSDSQSAAKPLGTARRAIHARENHSRCVNFFRVTLRPGTSDILGNQMDTGDPLADEPICRRPSPSRMSNTTRHEVAGGGQIEHSDWRELTLAQFACGFYCLVVAGLLQAQNPTAAHQSAVHIVLPLLIRIPWLARRAISKAQLLRIWQNDPGMRSIPAGTWSTP
jgi:hypothetical protein